MVRSITNGKLEFPMEKKRMPIRSQIRLNTDSELISSSVK